MVERANDEGAPMITRRRFLADGAMVATAAGVELPVWARVMNVARAAVDPTAASAGLVEHGLLLGVDYYPDQTPESLWSEDARMIAEAGLTNVRVAEFAWSLMEPSEGKFDFAWLARSVEILHKHGIEVILGTPSAAPPPWLSEKYPEILLVNNQGTTVQPGGRRFTCPTNKVYRKLSLAIATEMAKTFAETPGGALLLQVLPHRIPGLGKEKTRNAGRCESEMGHSVLEPGVHGVEADSRTAPVEWRPESGTGIGLRPVSIVCECVVCRGATGDAAEDLSAAFCDD
ncbi:MAG: hypothetical protein DMG34_09210 [Acidobacteria bacterium]|nr:MAG: hypothetical protein DMG34_09210 [Acidobacteriota bacterium]